MIKEEVGIGQCRKFHGHLEAHRIKKNNSPLNELRNWINSIRMFRKVAKEGIKVEIMLWHIELNTQERTMFMWIKIVLLMHHVQLNT